jgi:hypothetical protein
MQMFLFQLFFLEKQLVEAGNKKGNIMQEARNKERDIE